MYYTTRYDIPIAGVVKMGQMEPAFVCFAVGACISFVRPRPRDKTYKEPQPIRNATVFFFLFPRDRDSY